MAPDTPRSSKALIGFGTVLTLIGLVGLAILVIKGPDTSNSTSPNDRGVQTAERSQNRAVPKLSALAVALGVIITGVGSSYAQR